MEPNGGALVSGEGVRLALATAGVGSRTIAALIDVVIQALALLVLLLVDTPLLGSTDDAAASAVVLVEVVLVIAGYPIVAEWTTRGRTIGKLCMGLRVVRDDGGPIGLRQALTRGLAGLVLEKPGLLFPLTTIAGVVTISVSAREKRIGDMMAGTIVLNERAANQPPVTPPWWVPPPLQPWAFALDLHRFDDVLALRTRQFVTRAPGFSAAAQFALGEELRHRVLAVISPSPPPGAPTAFVLSSVLAERRRRAFGVPVREAPSRPAGPAVTASPWARPAAPPSRPGGPPDSPFAPPG